MVSIVVWHPTNFVYIKQFLKSLQILLDVNIYLPIQKEVRNFVLIHIFVFFCALLLHWVKVPITGKCIAKNTFHQGNT